MDGDSASGLPSRLFIRIVGDGDRVSQPGPVIEVVGQPIHFIALEQPAYYIVLNRNIIVYQYNSGHSDGQVSSLPAPSLWQ